MSRTELRIPNSFGYESPASSLLPQYFVAITAISNKASGSYIHARKKIAEFTCLLCDNQESFSNLS
jgi:hypothetical protein